MNLEIFKNKVIKASKVIGKQALRVVKTFLTIAWMSFLIRLFIISVTTGSPAAILLLSLSLVVFTIQMDLGHNKFYIPSIYRKSIQMDMSEVRILTMKGGDIKMTIEELYKIMEEELMPEVTEGEVYKIINEELNGQFMSEY